MRIGDPRPFTILKPGRPSRPQRLLMLSCLAAALISFGWNGPLLAQSGESIMPSPADEAPTRPSGRMRGSFALRSRQSPEFQQTFQALVDPYADAVVAIVVNDKQVALGTIVSKSGLLVSKSSVIPDEVQIRLSDNREVTAHVLARSESLDLALIDMGVSDVQTPIVFNRDAELTGGSFLITPGAERKVKYVGIAVAAPREFRIGRGGGRGRSGGYLGVQTTPIETGGLAITQVVPNSAAVKAGLRPGDRITHVAGTAVESPVQLASLLSSHKPGEEVELRFLRDDSELSVVAKLGELQPATAAYDRWGGGPFSDERRFGFGGAVIPHDTPLQPNECGGPILNSRGDVVGINISRALRVATYALPAEAVAQFIAENQPAAK